jgi:drug/metabolite transporter (DMT)-like permease
VADNEAGGHGTRRAPTILPVTTKAGTMAIEVVLALAASVLTASASILQRAAAAPAPGELRFSWRLIAFLLHRPNWFLGIVCMIGAFCFQLAALRSGELALVQPVIASELLFVFGYLALRRRGTVRWPDWVAAIGMATSLGGLLYVADPVGGSSTGPGLWLWLLAALCVASAAGAVVALSRMRSRNGPPSPGRRAALLGVSAGMVWGFVAAIVKEVSHFTGQGWSGVFTSWSPYALAAAGAVGLFLASNAFQAGPLAASQPGLTVVEPLVAAMLGVTLFGEDIHHGAWHLATEGLLLAVLVGSVVLLSRSAVVAIDEPVPPAAAGPGPAARSKSKAHMAG